jgi:hypothetical protein
VTTGEGAAASGSLSDARAHLPEAAGRRVGGERDRRAPGARGQAEQHLAQGLDSGAAGRPAQFVPRPGGVQRGQIECQVEQTGCVGTR